MEKKRFKEKALAVAAGIVLAVLPNAAKAKSPSVIPPFVWFVNASSSGHSNILYSPYAFGIGKSGLVQERMEYSPYSGGLVSENMKYSPYAFGIGKSGLISEEFEYNPYAFGVGNNGLISKIDGSSPNESRIIRHDTCSSSTIIMYNPRFSPTCPTEAPAKTSAEIASERKAKIAAQKERIAKLQEIKNADPIKGFYRFFEENKVDFRKENGLSIENKVIGANFLLNDCNTLVVYFNISEIKNLKENRKAFLKNYVKRVQQDIKGYESQGLEIIYVPYGGDEKKTGLENLLSQQPSGN
jgi:hypothetical protein